MFFVEPGDSLHIVVEEGTYSFSGPNADNNRFFAELFPRLARHSLGLRGLEGGGLFASSGPVVAG